MFPCLIAQNRRNFMFQFWFQIFAQSHFQSLVWTLKKWPEAWFRLNEWCLRLSVHKFPLNLKNSLQFYEQSWKKTNFSVCHHKHRNARFQVSSRRKKNEVFMSWSELKLHMLTSLRTTFWSLSIGNRTWWINFD